MKLVDLTGQKFGHLTVLKRQGSDDDGHATWLCACDCGGEIVVRGASLRRGHTVGCGCQQNKLINEIGNRYGRLTVIKRASNGPNGTMWLCQCDCGNEVIVKASNLRAGYQTGCGCHHPLPEGEAAFNALCTRFKHRAKEKALPFSLSKAQLLKLFKSNCFYCGAEPAMKIGGSSYSSLNGAFVYNGLDRLNNDRGYVLDNVVPCCGTCNHAKATLSVDEFKSLICRIYENWAAKDY